MHDRGSRRERRADWFRRRGGRAEELAVLRRRFTRRWMTGVAIGLVLAVVNGVGYRLLADGIAQELDGSSDTLRQLHWFREANALLGFVVVAVLVLLALVVFRPLDRTLRRELDKIDRIETEQLRASGQAQFESDLRDALEMARDERATEAVVRHVLVNEMPDRPAELLLADASDAHLTRRAEHPLAGSPGCTVIEPFDCPAVRRARPLTFESSERVNVCPYLRDRPDQARSAHCVPLAFMGRSMGVLHSVGPDREPLDADLARRMEVLAAQIGTHLGTLRAFATAQLQASTDPLTGLDNRRSMEDELSRRLAVGEPFAIALADLDDFKTLNDTFGHEAGDRALRLFADTLRRALRTEDLFARWGGEEFLIALPGMDRYRAVDVLDRARLALMDACARAETPAVTASFGVSDTSMSFSLLELVRFADGGLLTAKSSGKDQVRLGSPPAELASNDVAASNGDSADQPSNTMVLRP